MPESLSFRIAALHIALQTSACAGSFTRQGRFADFAADGLADVSLQADCSRAMDFYPGTPVFESGQSWRLYRDGPLWQLHVRSAAQDPYQLGIFEADFRTGTIFVPRLSHSPETYPFPLSYPLGEIYMTNLLGCGLGVMLHACGVVDHGAGYLFAGVSTAGKTTTARLWSGLPGVQVLNDDHIIVRQAGGQFRLYGTPWHGQGGMALPDDAPLQAIFILRHASQHQAVRLTPSEAVAQLIVRCFAPFWDSAGMQFTLELLASLCEAVPCFELGFTPDSSVVDYVRCVPLN